MSMRAWIAFNFFVFPGQADSQRGIVTQLTIRLDIDLATFCDIWSLIQPQMIILIFDIQYPATSWLPTPNHHIHRSTCGID